MSLDRLDDDPSALVTLLASAYSRGTSDQRDIFNAVGNRRMSVLGRAAPRLATAFRTSPEPFVLMLDDLQELRSPASHDVLTVVISGIPDGSQFVSASRSEQPHLPRLRASGEAYEFLANDLALDSAGVEQIFSTADVSLSPDMAKTVETRTEGWPAGIYLTALIARGNDDALTVTGDDPYVADYLYRESLSRLPESDRKFLRRTSILEQFCAPLCDVVVGESGSQERLRHLESTNSFLIPLDRRREWFRYHGLFREFLEGELRRVEPDVATKIHLQAADWFEEHGSPGLALEHLLKTQQLDRSLRLANQLIPPTYQKGQMSKVQRWLTQLGDPAIASYPPLAVLAGWVAALTGQDLEAERWSVIIDASSFDGVPADGTASFESGRAMLRGTMVDRGT